MFLLDLPVEMLLCIAESLDQARDLFALACLNHAANDLFLDYLYTFNVRHQRSSALFWGVRRGKSKFVKMMLGDYQADANTTDDRSRTPIFHAIRAKNETIIRTLLVDKRADINWQDQCRQTPLVYAIERNLLSTASLLLDFNPCLNITDVKHRSAIWYAIASCDENLVQVLLEQGQRYTNARLQTIFTIQPCYCQEDPENYPAVTPSFRFQFKKDPTGGWHYQKPSAPSGCTGKPS